MSEHPYRLIECMLPSFTSSTLHSIQILEVMRACSHLFAGRTVAWHCLALQDSCGTSAGWMWGAADCRRAVLQRRAEALSYGEVIMHPYTWPGIPGPPVAAVLQTRVGCCMCVYSGGVGWKPACLGIASWSSNRMLYARLVHRTHPLQSTPLPPCSMLSAAVTVVIHGAHTGTAGPVRPSCLVGGCLSL